MTLREQVGVLSVNRLAARREPQNLDGRKGFAAPPAAPPAPIQNRRLAEHVQPLGRKNVGEATSMTESSEQTRTDGWAQGRIAAGRLAGGIPRYGSVEWLALDPADPRFVAAVVVAAECWRDHCSPERVAAELAEQLEYEDWQVRARLAEASHDVSEAWSELVEPWSVPSFAELQRRRGEVAA